MGRNSLGRSPRAVLSDPAGEARDADLPPDLVPDAVRGARNRLLGQAICKLVSGHPLMSRDQRERECVCSQLYLSIYIRPEWIMAAAGFYI